jgi:predicted nucleic acid-binding protein
MNKILIDSSVWIGFFRGVEEAKQLLQLLDSNMICTNDLIIAELVPYLIHKNENELVNLLKSIEKIKIDIDWSEITQMQVQNLKKGLNRVGIPDLIIAQNAIQNKLTLFSFDKHFELMKKSIGLSIYSKKY